MRNCCFFEKNLHNRLETAIAYGIIPAPAPDAPFPPFEFKLLSVPKKKKITIKAHTPRATDIIGYEYEFKIKTANELLKIGFETGFGEKGSQGFGCVKKF